MNLELGAPGPRECLSCRKTAMRSRVLTAHRLVAGQRGIDHIPVAFQKVLWYIPVGNQEVLPNARKTRRPAENPSPDGSQNP